MDSCRAWWVAEPPEEMPYPLDALRMEFAAHKLCFHNARLPYPYIETHLRLFVGHREVGDYRLITLSDGRVDDDYLIFE